VVADYIESLLLPANLSAKYLVPFTTSVLSGRFLGAACVIAASVILIAASRSRMTAIGGAWFGIALLPFLNIIPISTLRADRYLYVATLGMGLLFAAALVAVRSGALRWTLGLLVFLSLGLLSWERAHVWVDSVALWCDTVAKSPLSPMSQANLGEAYLARGQRPSAEAQFERALECDPDFCLALTNLSLMWRDSGKKAEAMRAARRAVKADPRNAEARLSLGILQAEEGDLDTAYLTFDEAVNLDPFLGEAYFDMAGVRMLQKRPEDALALCQKAVAVQPNFADAHLRLGTLLGQSGRFPEAIAAFQRVCQLRPDSTDAFFNLAITYLRLSQFDPAEKAALQAQKLGMPAAQNLLNQIQSQKNAKPQTPSK